LQTFRDIEIPMFPRGSNISEGGYLKDYLLVPPNKVIEDRGFVEGGYE